MTARQVLRSLARRVRGYHEKYLGDVGYLARQIHYRQTAWRERDEISRRQAAAARNLDRASPQARTIAAALERDGYFITSVDKLGLSPEVVSYCRRLAEPAIDLSLADITKLRSGGSKIYWIDLYGDVQEECTPITAFVGSRDIADVCSIYLGQAPFVHELSLYHTPAGAAWLPPAKLASQNWHLDNDRPRRIKLFMLPFGADVEAGATMFLPKPHAPLNRYRNFPAYFDDNQFRAFGLDPRQIVHFTGDAGAVLFFDTSRLYHCGSRTKSKSRTVLNIDLSPVTSYLPYPQLANGPLRRPRFAKLNELLLR